MSDIYKFVAQTYDYYIVADNKGVTKKIKGTFYRYIDGSHHIIQRNEKLYIIAYQKNEVIYEFDGVDMDHIYYFNTIPTLITSTLRHMMRMNNMPKFIDYSCGKRITEVIITFGFRNGIYPNTRVYNVTDLKNIIMTERPRSDEDKYIYLTKNIYLKYEHPHSWLCYKYIDESVQNSLKYKISSYRIASNLTLRHSYVYCYGNTIVVNKCSYVRILHFNINSNGIPDIIYDVSDYICDLEHMLTMNDKYAYYMIKPKSECNVGIINLKTLKQKIVHIKDHRIQTVINNGDSLIFAQKRVLSKTNTCMKMVKYNRNLKELNVPISDIVLPIKRYYKEFMLQIQIQPDMKDYMNGLKSITNKLIIHTDLWYIIFKYL
jgi:hypothetical protein